MRSTEHSETRVIKQSSELKDQAFEQKREWNCKKQTLTFSCPYKCDKHIKVI